MQRIFRIVLVASCLASAAAAQFMSLGGAGMVPTDNCDIAFGDFDRDGDLDILDIGSRNQNGGPPFTELYRNDGGMPPTLVPINNGGGATSLIPALDTASAAWGDYDGDGWIDLLVAGSTGPGSRFAAIYHNVPDPSNPGSRTLVDINAGLTGVGAEETFPAPPPDTDGHSAVAWFDMDLDGDLDAVVAGHTGVADSQPTSARLITTIYQNMGSNTFVPLPVQPLTGVRLPSIAPGDYDGDGLVDLLITGDDGASTGCHYPPAAPVYYLTPNTSLYRNLGNGAFQSVPVPFPGVFNGDADWGDFDLDGDLDVVLCGSNNACAQNDIARVFRNDGGGSFTDVSATVWPNGLPTLGSASVAVGDVDCDFDFDIVIQGQGSGTDIYLNMGGFAFAAQNAATTSGFLNTYSGDIEIGDLDGNGTLDLANAGRFQIRLYANTGPGAWAAGGTFLPGTGDDFAISMSLNGAVVTPGNSLAMAGDILTISLFSPAGTCYAIPGTSGPQLLLGVEVFSCGNLPQSPAPFIYVDSGVFFLIGPGGPLNFITTLYAPGTTINLSVPTGILPGVQAIFQGLLFQTPCAANGIYASTDAPTLHF